ncbi:MAG: AI-2E family transporter [Acidobacteriota bacterium]|nr:AI-2E family transporter [Acidobacteriota bacterium]
MNSTLDEEVKRESVSLAFARRVLIATLVVASVVLVLYFVWYAADLLMLVFAGVLVSILLRGFTRFLAQKTGMGRGISLGIVSLALVALIVVVVWLVTGRIGAQMSELRRQLPVAVENVMRYVGQYEWARSAIDGLPDLNDWLAARSPTIISRLTGLASTTLGTVVNVVIVIIIGLYLASQPDLYSRGIKHLLPFRYRERAGEVLGEIDESLHRWLIGRFALMTLNGALTALGLWLLGVPLAITLGLLMGLLNFVPNFGPWIAAVPALLIAFLQSPQQALYVGLLYLVIQVLDAYVLTPLVDRKSVELPPVLTITAQVLLGLVFGFIGLLLASPLTAAVMILVKMLYVEDVIGDRVMNEGGEAEGEERGAKRAGDAGDV